MIYLIRTGIICQSSWNEVNKLMGGPAYIDGKEYDEFDNFYKAPFEHGGVVYPTVEHGFQAQKNDSKEYREALLNVNAYEAWGLGQKIKLVDHWEDIKYSVMVEMMSLKFCTHRNLAEMLVETNGPIKFKGSTQYWNKANAEILQAVRYNFKLIYRICKEKNARQ